MKKSLIFVLLSLNIALPWASFAQDKANSQLSSIGNALEKSQPVPVEKKIAQLEQQVKELQDQLQKLSRIAQLLQKQRDALASEVQNLQLTQSDPQDFKGDQK